MQIQSANLFSFFCCARHNRLRLIDLSCLTSREYTSATQQRAVRFAGLDLAQTTFAGTVHYGIFCKKTVISKGSRLGPFRGKQVNTSEIKTNDDNSFMWEVSVFVCESHNFATRIFLSKVFCTIVLILDLHGRKTVALRGRERKLRQLDGVCELRPIRAGAKSHRHAGASRFHICLSQEKVVSCITVNEQIFFVVFQTQKSFVRVISVHRSVRFCPPKHPVLTSAHFCFRRTERSGTRRAKTFRREQSCLFGTATSTSSSWAYPWL